MGKPSREIFVKYYKMKNKLIFDQERIEGLKEFKESLIEEMPDSKLISAIDADIQALKENASKLQVVLEQEKGLVKSKLSLISDVSARVAASLHYIDGLNWDEVAQIMKMDNMEATRSMVYRNFRRCGL